MWVITKNVWERWEKNNLRGRKGLLGGSPSEKLCGGAKVAHFNGKGG